MKRERREPGPCKSCGRGWIATWTVFVAAQAVSGEETMTKELERKLWYRQPAAEWVEALPIGNGRAGDLRVQFENHGEANGKAKKVSNRKNT